MFLVGQAVCSPSYQYCTVCCKRSKGLSSCLCWSAPTQRYCRLRNQTELIFVAYGLTFPIRTTCFLFLLCSRVQVIQRCSTFCGKGSQLLLWDASRAEREKITVSGTPNRLNYCVIFCVVYKIYTRGRGPHNVTWHAAVWILLLW
jgi:hypothetical protein